MCKGPEAGVSLLSLRKRKVLDGKWGSVRGQETMKSAGARALRKQEGTTGGLGTKASLETDTHTHTQSIFTQTPLYMHFPLPRRE